MKATEKLKYTNKNGEKVEFSFYSNYIPTLFVEELANNITSSKNSSQDGETFESSTLDSRYITIEGFFKLERNNYLENNLKKVLNPKLDAELEFTDETVQRKIRVKLEGKPNFTRSQGLCYFSADLKAHDPMWTETEKTEYLALLKPMLTWPIICQKEKGIIFGLRRSIMESDIENIGDIESGFRVLLKAKGEVRNPYIANVLTGEQIKINSLMEKGDVIEVINQPKQKQVFKNGIKSFPLLNRQETTFFNLEAGKNKLSYGAELNAVNLDVILFYSPLYM